MTNTDMFIKDSDGAMKDAAALMNECDAAMDIGVTVMNKAIANKMVCAVNMEDPTPIMEGIVQAGKVCVTR